MVSLDKTLPRVALLPAFGKLHLVQNQLARYHSSHEQRLEQQSLVVGTLIAALTTRVRTRSTSRPGPESPAAFLFGPPDQDHRNGSNGAWK